MATSNIPARQLSFVFSNPSVSITFFIFPGRAMNSKHAALRAWQPFSSATANVTATELTSMCLHRISSHTTFNLSSLNLFAAASNPCAMATTVSSSSSSIVSGSASVYMKCNIALNTLGSTPLISTRRRTPPGSFSFDAGVARSSASNTGDRAMSSHPWASKLSSPTWMVTSAPCFFHSRSLDGGTTTRGAAGVSAPPPPPPVSSSSSTFVQSWETVMSHMTVKASSLTHPDLARSFHAMNSLTP
nr:unnamed protein product [Digitaria exilis]